MKVLGFYKKDGILHEWNWLVNETKIVPVVSVKWLESFIKKNIFDEDFIIRPIDLLLKKG